MRTHADRSYACPAVLMLCFALLGITLARDVCAQQVAPELVIHQLTKDGKSYTERGGGFAPQGDRIVFYKEVTASDRQLWLMRGDGSQAEAISPVGWPMICGWSPDGTKVAYIFATKNDDNSEARVCVYDVASGETKKATGGYRRDDFGEGEEAPPVWSPDGNHFAYHIADHGTGIIHLWTFRASDGEATKLTANLQGTSSWDLTATWSPDSSWIAFLAFTTKQERDEWGNREIWKCHADGSELTQVTHDLCQLGDPAWSPRGDWILYHSDKGRTPEERREGWNWDIWMVRPDGSEAKAVTHGSRTGRSGRWSYVHTKWLPDGSGGYFHGWGHDEFARGTVIFLCDKNGDSLRPVMGPPGEHRHVTGYRKWASPDSRKLLRHALEYTERGEGDNARWEDIDDVIQIYDIPSDTLTDLVRSRREKDTYHINKDAQSWALDSRRILFTQGKVISWQREQYEPDLYVLELPGEATEQAVPEGATPAQPEEAPVEVSAAVPSEQVATELIRPKYLTVQQALDSLPEAEKSFLETNPERNLLIVNGPPEAAQRIRDYLAKIDTPAPQVTLDVLVMEMSKTASRELGLDWVHGEGHIGGRLPLGDLGPGQLFYRGVETLDEEFFVSLNALEQKGAVSIRANPRLVALSGSAATMNVRRTKYYFYTQGYDQYGRPYLQQSDISADITGKVTPHVLGDGNILVEVEVGVGNFTFTSTSSLPDVTSRQASAHIMVREGETITIGGLILSQETSSTSKTPILGDLPLIGQLFRSTHRQSEENVLTILITPHLGLERGETGVPGS
ncbi:MAG: PD40 domain-containing protein [Armatimonadota bacterium]|nr:MAG: PD40 domain-containing protein [Armatimonadota bacterium]